MKKIFFFLLALLVQWGGAWAQFTYKPNESNAITSGFSADKKYFIKSSSQGNGRFYMCANEAGTGITATAALPEVDNIENYLWTFTSNGDDTYTVKNVGKNTNLYFESDKNGYGVSLKESNGTTVTVDVSGNDVGLKNQHGQYIDMNHNGTSPVTWSGGVNGSRVMTIYEADTKYVVVYRVTATDGTNSVSWTLKKVYDDSPYGQTAAYPETYDFIPNIAVSNPDKTISESNYIFDCTATHTLPFVEGKLYQVATRNENSFLQYFPAGKLTNNTDAVYVKASASKTPDHLWYFKRVGNTPDKYYMYSLAANKGVRADQLSTTPYEYHLKKSTYANAGESGFTLVNGTSTLGGHTHAYYFGSANDKLAHWGGGNSYLNNEGNCFWATEVPIDDADLSMLQLISAESNTTVDGTYVGEFKGTDSEYNAAREKYTAFNDNKTLENLQAAIAAVNVKSIESNKFYQLVSRGNNNGKVFYSDTYNDKSGGSGQYDDRKMKIGTVGTSTTVPCSAVQFKLKNDGCTYQVQHANSKYWFMPLNNSSDLANPDLPIANGNAGNYIITSFEGANATTWALQCKENTDRYLHCGDTGEGNMLYTRQQSPETNDGCRWAIREITSVPVSVTDAQWSTLCLPMAVTVPTADDVAVYYVSEVSTEGAMTLTQINGGTTIAANTPVLIYSTASSFPQEYSFSVNYNNAGTSYSGTNKLSGTWARRKGFNTTESEYYGLAKLNNVVAFYPSTSEYIPANKAYMLKSSLTENTGEVHALFFDFGNQETAIEGVHAAKGNSVIYDLQGRRVQKMQRGNIYVINGRKVSIQ